MTERAYLSIGEVLTLLKPEFSDLTISKIRFLESQGLLCPERTPSGYRKFYEPDVDRLRWILREQQQHYLPLKVIKGKLVDDGTVGPAEPAGGESEDGAGDPSGRNGHMGDVVALNRSGGDNPVGSAAAGPAPPVAGAGPVPGVAAVPKPAGGPAQGPAGGPA